MGFDHETSEDDARVMEDKSRELVNLISNEE
jgi:ssRNA-specific RNase YbeY (16S rRNA maturation enzyme)